MSIFGSIVNAIFGSRSASASGTAATSPGTTGAGTTTASTTAASDATPATPGTGPMTRAQVEAMIQGIEDESGQNYNWRESIVDLMKLLDLDSSLKARQELAKELGYTGALNGSAEMNIWLHQQVMTRLMEGKDIPQG